MALKHGEGVGAKKICHIFKCNNKKVQVEFGQRKGKKRFCFVVKFLTQKVQNCAEREQNSNKQKQQSFFSSSSSVFIFTVSNFTIQFIITML